MKYDATDNQIKKYLYLGVHYHANNYYRKQNNYLSRVTLIDFQDLENFLHLHQNYSEYSESNPINNVFDFVNQLENDSLMTILIHLSNKERTFIFEKFFLQKTDTEIAKEKNYHNKLYHYIKKDY